MRAEVPPPDGPPRLLQPVDPEYPATLKEQRVTGWAEIGFRVDENGTVGDITVVDTSFAEFGRAAADAVRQFKYQPAYKNGRPCAVRAQIPIIFDFDDDELAEMDSHRAKEVLPPGPPTVEISAVDEWPELKKEIHPATPAVLKAKSWMGQATVDFVVDENGDPRDVHVVATTHHECAEPAVVAVRQWKFTPGR